MDWPPSRGPLEVQKAISVTVAPIWVQIVGLGPFPPMVSSVGIHKISRPVDVTSSLALILLRDADSLFFVDFSRRAVIASLPLPCMPLIFSL